MDLAVVSASWNTPSNKRFADVMNSGLIADLRRIVGARNLSANREDIDRYSGDALGVYRAFGGAHRLLAKPSVLTWPSDSLQVSQVLRFAQRQQVPVVPYGGGTGVMGAATPSDGCIVLNLQRMNTVLDISKEDLTARVQAGTILETVAAALNGSDLVFGHDPWSRPIATVGGAISTNGVGYTAAEHGSMGQQVLGLEVVLADGEVIRTRNVPKPSYGPSLNHLFIGSEGTLGVITEATLRAFPRPEKRVSREIVFPDFESGFRAVSKLYAEGVRPTVVDFGDELWSEEPSESREATLYLAFEGFSQGVDAQYSRASDICHTLGGRDGDQQEAKIFWDTRHASADRYRQQVLESSDPGKARRRSLGYKMDYLHVALPVSQVLEYRRRCQKILADHRVVVREWSLWGRPEFLSFLIVEGEGAKEPNSVPMAVTVDEVLTLAQEMGGTMEYCHGVGIKLAHLMDREMGAGMAVLRRLKGALDPNNILNPGKLGI